MLEQRLAAARGEADAERGRRVAVEPAVGEEAPALDGVAGAAQLLGVVLGGGAVRLDEALPLADLVAAGGAARTGAAVVVLVVQLVAQARGEQLDGLGEAEVVDVLHERDDVATLAAAEAVPEADLRAHVERGGLLVVERAEALEGADAGALQRDVLGDDLVDPRALADVLDVVTADPHLSRPPITWPQSR